MKCSVQLLGPTCGIFGSSPITNSNWFTDVCAVSPGKLFSSVPALSPLFCGTGKPCRSATVTFFSLLAFSQWFSKPVFLAEMVSDERALCRTGLVEVPDVCVVDCTVGKGCDAVLCPLTEPSQRMRELATRALPITSLFACFSSQSLSP